MATDTQKKFRREMGELANKRNEIQTPRVYSYINKDFVDNRVKINKRRIISFSGIITFIALMMYFSPFIKSVINRYVSYNQRPIISYLEKIDTYNKQFNSVFTKTNNDVKNLDMKSLDSRNQFIYSMNDNLNAIQNIISDVNAIKAPEDLSRYKELTIQMYKDVVSVTNNYIKGVSRNSQSNFDSADEYINQYNNDSAKRRVELMNIFDKYKIKYETQPNGSLRYWYNTNQGI